MTKRSFLICLMIVTFGFPACSREEKTPLSRTSPQQEGQAAPVSGGSAPQKSTGDLTVKILPESPTVMTDLQVVNSGTGKITFQWQRNSQVISGETGARLAKNQFVRGDVISVTVMSDSTEGMASVTIGNSPPKVVSVPFSPEYIHAGADITVKPVGYDPDGDEVGFHYKWSINGKEVFEDSPVLAGNRFKRGDIVTLKVIPYDKDGEGEPFVSQNMVIPKAPPRITSTPPQNVQGDVYTYHVVVEDPEGDPITFSLASAPPGMTIDGKTGLITWRVSEKYAGTHVVEIVAQDPLGIKVTQKYPLSITMKEGGR